MSVAAPASSTTEELTVRGVATAADAAQLRDEFGTWLYDHGVAAPQRSEITLAVYEALANCVDHAYVDHSAPGPMAVRADFRPATRCLSVCVTDHGTWRQPSRNSPDAKRGRGIALMHAMADHCTVSGRRNGTTVCLDYRCGSDASPHVSGT